jgi:hypothetical protein
VDSKARIDQVFANLDRWRHFPAYQLERRADIFFSLYLPEILEQHFHCGPWTIIPEFPLNISVKNPLAKSMHSVKLDYLAVTYNLDRLVFVELKTEPASRNETQDKFLLKAQKKGMFQILDDLQPMYRNSKAKSKYRCLFKELHRAGFTDEVGNVIAGKQFPKPEIVYIQPVMDKEIPGVISFKTVAKIAASHNDDLSQRFAKSLLEWETLRAGHQSCPSGEKAKV